MGRIGHCMLYEPKGELMLLAIQAFVGRTEGGAGESGRQGIDARQQRGYHFPHGRSSWLVASATSNVGASPLVSTALSTASDRANTCGNLRQVRFVGGGVGVGQARRGVGGSQRQPLGQ